LIETCRGFDFVLEESPAALAKYDLVIVLNVECMSLDQIKGFLSDVEGGGSFLVAQDSAMFDLWHRRRIENPWATLFGTASAKNVVADAVAADFAGTFVAAHPTNQSEQLTLASYGKGRAVYVPMVVNPASQPALWVVPEHADEFNRGIDWLMNGREVFTVSAERGLLAEYLSQKESGRRLVHLVNMRSEHSAIAGWISDSKTLRRSQCSLRQLMYRRNGESTTLTTRRRSSSPGWIPTPLSWPPRPPELHTKNRFTKNIIHGSDSIVAEIIFAGR